MPRAKRAIHPAAGASDEAVAKPVPPDDMWGKIDAAIAALPGPVRPHNSFTAYEYAAKHGHGENWARRRLNALVKLGKLGKNGKWFRLLED